MSFVDLNGDGRNELLMNNHVDDATAAVFAFEVPADIYHGTFVRHTLASGFKTVAWGIGSASPGFAYAFYPDTKNTTGPAYIAVAGDGAYQTYLLTPTGPHFGYNLSVRANVD